VNVPVPLAAIHLRPLTDKEIVSFATVASMFFWAWPRSTHRKVTPEGSASHSDLRNCLEDQLLRSQLELTWSLAKLALELKSDSDGRPSSDMARAMEVALEKAERYSRQIAKNEPALMHLNSLKQAIAGLSLEACAAEPLQGCVEATHEVIR
jgi:hypothetical protein